MRWDRGIFNGSHVFSFVFSCKVLWIISCVSTNLIMEWNGKFSAFLADFPHLCKSLPSGSRVINELFFFLACGVNATLLQKIEHSCNCRYLPPWKLIELAYTDGPPPDIVSQNELHIFFNGVKHKGNSKDAEQCFEDVSSVMCPRCSGFQIIIYFFWVTG